MKKYKPVKIFCPQCKGYVGTHDGRSTMPKSVKCNICNKLVVYNLETGKTEIKPIPQRTQGSGVTFI